MKLLSTSLFVLLPLLVFAGCTAEQDLGARPDGGTDPGLPGDAPSGPDGGAGDGSTSPGIEPGPCTANELRCSGNTVVQCDPSGASWVPKQSCTTYCAAGQCALDGLDIPKDQALDGVVYVKGAVVVHAGATLTAPKGDLTLIADSITVEKGGSIAAAPVGVDPTLQGATGVVKSYKRDFNQVYDFSVSGGGPGRAAGADTDSEVGRGGPGGTRAGSKLAAAGGGAIRLLARTIVVAGQVTANGANGESSTACGGGGGGGAGGGILAAGDDVTMSGAISAVGGTGGTTTSGCSAGSFGGIQSASGGADGGKGRVKLLWGAKRAITGSILGTPTQGLMPPIPVASSSHPDPSQIYNDDVASLHLTWTKPFASSAGYYASLDATSSHPPGPLAGQFLNKELVDFAPAALVQGDNFFHVVSVDGASQVGAVESVFRVKVNTKGAVVTSTSHPDSAAWSTNSSAFFAWSFPQGDSSVKGAYYVLDHYGVTVPATTSTFVPTTQKQLVQSGLAPGVWVLHVVSVDQAGRRTKEAGHYRVSVGSDPGSGGVTGHVVDATSNPLVGATVTVNRGLYTQTTNGSGNYSFSGIPAGAWEVTVTSGAKTTTKNVVVAKDAISPADLAL